MTTQDYRSKPLLVIFLSYFKRHRKLFALDILCATGIAAIDLAFPLVTRSALYDMLPNQRDNVKGGTYDNARLSKQAPAGDFPKLF